MSKRQKKGEMVSVMTGTASCKGQAIWKMGMKKKTNTRTQEVKRKPYLRTEQLLCERGRGKEKIIRRKPFTNRRPPTCHAVRGKKNSTFVKSQC